MRRHVTAVLLAATFPLSARAAAAGTQQEALAEQLFDEGRELVAARRYAEACDKFAESQRLAPAAGTLANLAVCHETIGKTATAWVELKEVEAEDRASGTTVRRALLAHHLAEIEPRLAHVVVRVDSTAAATPGLRVAVDDVAIGAAAWGSPMPLDPGPHVVTASAPGKASRELRVVVKAPGELAAVDIAALVDADALPVAPPAPAPPVSMAPPPAATPEEPPPRVDRRLLAGVVAGAGLAAVGVGTYFGLAAISDRNSSDAQCNPGCSQHAVSLNGSAMTEATVSTVAFGVGLVGLAAGAYLFFTARSPTSREPPAAVAIGPFASPVAQGLSVRASW